LVRASLATKKSVSHLQTLQFLAHFLHRNLVMALLRLHQAWPFMVLLGTILQLAEAGRDSIARRRIIYGQAFRAQSQGLLEVGMAESVVGPVVPWTEERVRHLTPGAVFGETVRAMENVDKATPQECSQRFGAAMVHSMRADQVDLCSRIGSEHNSAVLCHKRVPFDIPRYTCSMRNVMVSKAGTEATGCTPTSALSQIVKENGVVERTLFGKGSAYGSLRLVDSLQCESHVDHPVLFQMPWDLNNFYEWYGDWVTLWETLNLMQWNPDAAEVYLLQPDQGSHAYKRVFDEAWSRAFSAKGVRWGSQEELFGDGVCFSHLVGVPHGGLSTFTFSGGRSGASADCPSSTMMASSLFLRGLFPPDVDKSGESMVQTTKQVTLLLRKGGSRAFNNDAETEESLRRVLPASWTLELFRPETLSMSQQLALAARTKVLVGTHGAGLTFALFLPPKARLVEVYCGDRGSSNGHYRSLEGMAEPATSKGSGVSEGRFHFSIGSHDGCTLDTAVVQKAIAAYEQGL